MLIDLQPAAGPALVVGGGTIALRRAKLLAEAEFEIVIVAPVLSAELRLLPFVTVFERTFAEGDIALRDFALVLACTDDRDVNHEIGRLARAARIPVVVADRKEESTFFTPATIREGGFAIAVSTGGASPEVARSIRARIVEVVAPYSYQLRKAHAEREVRLRAARGERPI
ncbi:MAG: bifunctional precorrin-2 dehydrogenase/sirohydrochlorin ferrochelatase [Dehalococcoidia bacterium]